MILGFAQTIDCNSNGTGTIDRYFGGSFTIYPNCNRTGALDEILRIWPSSGVVENQVIENPIIENRPEIRNRGSHNNHYGSHDNKRGCT